MSRDVGEGAEGYNALALERLWPELQGGPGHPRSTCTTRRHGTGPRDEVGCVLYTRGVIISMLTVEAIRTAQEKFGKGKPMTGEQVRWATKT